MVSEISMMHYDYELTPKYDKNVLEHDVTCAQIHKNNGEQLLHNI